MKSSLERVLGDENMMSGVPAAIMAQLSTCAAGGEEPTLRQVKCGQTSEIWLRYIAIILQGTLQSLHPSTLQFELVWTILDLSPSKLVWTYTHSSWTIRIPVRDLRWHAIKQYRYQSMSSRVNMRWMEGVQPWNRAILSCNNYCKWTENLNRDILRTVFTR